AGNATIIYTFSNSCGSPTASQMITVNKLPNAGTVSGASSVCIGSQATFTSSGLSGGSWSSSNPAAATVNSTTGVVVGVATGSATITYTSTTPCGSLIASANISVNPVLNAGTVNGASTLCIGSTTPYTSNGSAGGTWSSVTPSVATVNATTGVVTGISTGNATITYTLSSGCGTFSATKMIAVSLAANTGTISGPSTVCTGTTVNFTRSGGSAGGTWSSSNNAVATVNNSGIVTGVSTGTAIISYSVSSSCGIGSSTKSITVNSSLSLTATNFNASTDPTSCSSTLTLGSNVTTTGSPTLQYRIGFYPFFSFPISATHTFYRGTTPVVVIASNSCGTIARMFLVTVTDNTPPSIACKANAIRSTDGNSSRYSVRGHEFDATATDGCGVSSLVYSLSGATVDGFDRDNTSLNNVRLNIGITTITWKATDVNGNVSTCSSTVTVNGNGNPKNFGRIAEPSLSVKVAPNPTSNYFTLQFKSESIEKVNMKVVDVTGRTVEEIRNIWPNSTIQIGGKYHPGIYLVKAIQGTESVSLKLIKEGN
ncbi:MAG TPA: Ig-like domain-containing protein, partial [Hanamia sp.]